MVEFYLLTFPRFPLRKKEHKSYFGKNRTHDFRTSRCASYLLDHSGDELLKVHNAITIVHRFDSLKSLEWDHLKLLSSEQLYSVSSSHVAPVNAADPRGIS